LAQSIRRDRKEVLTGARRAYEEAAAPAERARDQAIADAERVRGKAEVALFLHEDEEIRRWLSEEHDIDSRLLGEVKAAQEEASRKARETMLLASPSWFAERDGNSEGQPRPEARSDGALAAGFSDEIVAAIHLKAAIGRSYEEAEAAAHRAYRVAIAPAERAYDRAMAGPEPTTGVSAGVRADWDMLVQLADRITQLGELVTQAIGRFAFVDVTRNRDRILRDKENVKKELGLPKAPPPPRPPSGPRDPGVAAWVRAQHAAGRSPKQIRRMLMAKNAKAGVRTSSLSTIYRWLKTP
jgi:hypothetical protein